MDQTVSIAFIGFIGACVGSFLNVVIARLPYGESVVHPRSRCPKCGDRIPAYLNVPVISWVVLAGKCRACRWPIPVRYPLVEVMSGALFVACLMKFGWGKEAATGALLCAALLAITFIDLDHWEIPDEISLPGTLIGVFLGPYAFTRPWYSGLLGALLGAGFFWGLRWMYFLFRKREAMGLGDVKLIAMTGAFLGPMSLPPTIVVASFTGVIVGVALILMGKLEDQGNDPQEVLEESATETEDEEEWVPPKYAIPYGPFLSLGAIADLFFHPQLLMLNTQFQMWVVTLLR